MTPSEFTLRLAYHAAGIEAALWTLCTLAALDLSARLFGLLLWYRRGQR